jgi:hypothetical protein
MTRRPEGRRYRRWVVEIDDDTEPRVPADRPCCGSA